MHASRVWLHGSCGFLLVCCGFLACGSNDEQHQAPSNGGDASAGETASMAGAGVGATNAGGGDRPGNGGGPEATAGASVGGEGAGGAGATNGDDLGALNAFCQGFAETECAARAACYPETNSVCLADTISSCHEYARAELLPAMKAGLVVFHPEKQAGCFKLPKVGFCDVNNLWIDPDCVAAFTGTATGDETCYSVYLLGRTIHTCAAGRCVAEAGCGSGRCLPYLLKGDTCLTGETLIAPGCGESLLCDRTTKKCVGEKALHAACTSVGDACNRSLPQLTCVPKADGKGGLECDVPRADGAWCGAPDLQVSAACASSVCRDDHCVGKDLDGVQLCFNGNSCPKGQACFLEPANPVCRTALTKGKACRTVGKECAPELTCIAGADPMAGTCQPRLAAGSTCGATEQCADGLSCVHLADASTCRALVGKGKACSSFEECAGGLLCLSTKTCGDPLLFGEACTVDGDCDGGLYCEDASSTCQPWKRDGQNCERRQACIYDNGCTDAGICASMQCTADSL
jgi:hypothetical protein